MKIFRHNKEDKKIIPNKNGHYLICLRKNIELPNPGSKKIVLTEILDFNVIYTGIHKNIRSRFSIHFEKMDASRSTFQLSLGSLFGYKKYLDHKTKDQVKKRYKFDRSDAEKLKRWINKNCIFIYVKSCRNDYSKVKDDEETFIKKYNPPINLDKTSDLIDNKEFRKYLSEQRIHNKFD